MLEKVTLQAATVDTR